MQLHPTSRPRRVRRLIAVSAAAVAVMIAPTACDYGGAAQLDLPTHAGHTDGMNMEPQEHAVVPVGQTVTTTPSAEAEADADETTTAAAARVASERRRGDDGRRERGDRPTTPTTIPAPAGGGTGSAAPTASASNSASASAAASASANAGVGATTTAAAPTGSGPNGLDVLGQSCADSGLPAHTGFQSAKAECVNTSMGEIAPEDRLPSLLIVGAPRFVRVNEPFKLQISTRNLVRDRFLGAAAGGYYLESSFLQDGTNLQRGHFHTACRNLSSTRSAPDSSKTPEFFLATQDNGGGANADTVTVTVPGIKSAGVLQCTSWAGDGSHRTPMMSRANQTPAIDSVRIFVVNGRQRADNAAASDAVAPAATGSGANADAQADAAKQAQAEQAAAGAQAPDQDGAVQPKADTAAPADSTVPAATESAESEAPANN